MQSKPDSKSIAAACLGGLLLAGSTMAGAAPWIVSDQPDLKQALENAPVLKTESLGEPARGLQPWLHYAVPNPNGKSWNVLQCYQEYGNNTRQQLFMIDLASGDVKSCPVATHTPIYTSGTALGFDGKFYDFALNRKFGLSLFVYDPAANTWEDRGPLVTESGKYGGELRYNVVGPDQRIYGTDNAGNGKVGLYVYDTKLRQVVKDYGGVGPRHEIGSTISRGLGVDDRFAYIVSGDVPSYIVSVNLATGEDKVLFQTPTLSAPSGHRLEVIEEFPGARATVPDFGNGTFEQYWLYHGEAIPMEKGGPPWSKMPSPMSKAAPKPDIYWDDLEPDAEGKATLWWRPHGASNLIKSLPADARAQQSDWRAVALKGVETYAYRIAPLALLPDGRIYGTGDMYTGSFIFDPRSDKATPMGRIQGLSHYTSVAYGGKLYASGYPGGPLYVYDQKQPWTAFKGGPPGKPAPARNAGNPREIGGFADCTRVTIMHSSTEGADGKLYFGGTGHRNYTGGGFGWYDPKTEKLDGFWKPLSGFGVYDIAPALDRRLIVISTRTEPDEANNNQVPKEAKLFFYDMYERKIVREVAPAPNARATGMIAEVAPGRLLGLTVGTADEDHPGRGILYGVDATTGDVLFRKSLPWPVGASEYWPKWVDPSDDYLELARGPDGFLWSYLKNVLVRINPKDASVYVVGKIEQPGRPLFVGKDLYLAGAKQLRRIRNITKRIQPR